MNTRCYQRNKRAYRRMCLQSAYSYHRTGVAIYACTSVLAKDSFKSKNGNVVFV